MPGVGAIELVVILVIALLVIVVPIVVVARVLTARKTPDAAGRDAAIDAVRVRYANGEIDQAEYERLRSTLLRH